MSKKVFANGVKVFGDLTISKLIELHGDNIYIEAKQLYSVEDFDGAVNNLYVYGNSVDAWNIVKALVDVGRKLDAIKFVRNITEWGLREAKEFVEEHFYD